MGFCGDPQGSRPRTRDKMCSMSLRHGALAKPVGALRALVHAAVAGRRDR